MPRWWVYWNSGIFSDSYVMKIANEGKLSYCSNKQGKFELTNKLLSRRISYSFLQSTHLFWPCSYLFETLSYLFKPWSYYIFTVYIFVCVYFSQTNKLCDGKLHVASSYNEYDIFMDRLARTCTYNKISYLFGEITYLSRQTSFMFRRISFCLDKYMYAYFPRINMYFALANRTVFKSNFLRLIWWLIWLWRFDSVILLNLTIQWLSRFINAEEPWNDFFFRNILLK